MKKRNLKSLKLNKESISNFKVNGGKPPTSNHCAPMRSENNHTCEPIKINWLSIGGFVCWISDNGQGC